MKIITSRLNNLFSQIGLPTHVVSSENNGVKDMELFKNQLANIST